MGYILILGANTDIAKALAEKYASVGQNIYLADKNIENLDQMQQYLSESYNVDVQLLKLDITEFYNHRNFYNSLSPKPFGVICAIDYLGEQERSQKDFLEAKKIIDINYTGIVSLLNIIANDFEDREAGFIIAVSYSGDKKEEQANYTYKSAKAAFSEYVAGLRPRLDSAYVNVLTVMQGLSAENLERFAHEIFNAQQKGKPVIYAKECGALTSLVKGLRWK